MDGARRCVFAHVLAAWVRFVLRGDRIIAETDDVSVARVRRAMVQHAIRK
jgi:hypothetical protein